MTDKQKIKQWKTIAMRLAKCFDRFTIDCPELHHIKEEYHGGDKPCPVVEMIHKTLEEYETLLYGFEERCEICGNPDGSPRFKLIKEKDGKHYHAACQKLKQDIYEVLQK